MSGLGRQVHEYTYLVTFRVAVQFYITPLSSRVFRYSDTCFRHLSVEDTA